MLQLRIMVSRWDGPVEMSVNSVQIERQGNWLIVSIVSIEDAIEQGKSTRFENHETTISVGDTEVNLADGEFVTFRIRP